MRLRSVSTVIATLALLAACGGGADVSEVEPADQAASAPAPPTADLPDDASGDAPDGTSDSAGEDAAPGSVGDPDSAWCDLARGVDDASDRFDDIDITDPAAVEAAFDEMYERMLAALPAAPPELRDALEVSIEGFARLRAALVEVDWDFLVADLAVLDELGDELDAAGDRIDRYNQDVCGMPVDDEPDTDDGAFDPGAGTIGDQIVDLFVSVGFTQAEAECLFDNIDFTDPEATNDLDQIIPVFELCGIDLARLAELGG
ncbi:MAG TPA: hypothetical protein VIS05_12765 [Ilumatobacter sp.]